MSENELLRAFSQDLADLRATLSDKNKHQQLRKAIEQRERALAIVLEVDDKDQSAREALRQGNGTPAGADVKAAAAASKAMDTSGATSLKRLLVDTTVALAKLFNAVPDTLNHRLRKGTLKLGPAPGQEKQRKLASGAPLQLTDGKPPSSASSLSATELAQQNKDHKQVVRDIPRVHHEDLSVSEFLRKCVCPLLLLLCVVCAVRVCVVRGVCTGSCIVF